MKKWLFALALALALTVCTSCGEAEPLPANEVVPDASETENEPEPLLFPDTFTARRNLMLAQDMELPLSSYTKESGEAFLQVRTEVNAELRDSSTQAEIEALYRRVLEAKEALEISVERGDIARVYIYTEDRLHQSAYHPCRITVVGAEDENFPTLIYDGCEVKIRGNSTAGGPKFPVNIRFPEKVSPLGMDAGKKWVLLANLFDKTLMRNYIAFDFAEKIGLPYTSQSRFVDVYVDGALQGNYLMTEPVTDGKKKVDVDVENCDFIFEIDMNRDDGSYYFQPKLGQRMKVDKPEEVDEAGRELLRVFFRDMEAALLTHEMEQYSQYLDVDSFVNFYLHSELIKSIDVYDFSTRYFLRDGILYAGPVWDNDLSLGNASSTCAEDKYHIYGNWKRFGTKSGDSADGVWMDHYWFHELLQDPAFRERCLERLEEIAPIYENFYQDNECGSCVIDSLLEQYGASFRRNYDEAGWSETARYSGIEKDDTYPFDEEIQWLKDWMERRLAAVAFDLMA